MRIALLLAAIFTAQVRAAELRVSIVAESGCATGTLHAAPLCGAACPDDVAARSKAWSRPESAELVLGLDKSVAWRLSTDSACWSADTIVPAGRADTSLAVRVYPAATIGGRFRTARGVETPGAVTVTAQSIGAAAIPPSDLACKVLNDRWSCVAPAAGLDVRLHANGFVPHYLWSLHTTAGRRTDVGEIALVRGASLSGTVVVDGRVATLEGVRIAVSPSLPPAMGPGWQVEEQRRGLRTLTVTPNAKGFFQFPHLAAGTYDVVVTRDGWSPAKQREVRLEDEKEHRLDPLRLTPLARLELAIVPPLDPDAKPWVIELATGRFKTTVGKGPATATGAWKSAPLERGRYELVVRDTRNIVHVRQLVDVTENMPPLGISVKSFPLRGRVTLGGDPLQCELVFSNSYGKSVYMRTGNSGEIVTILPEDGRWRVEVRPPGAGAITREIEIRKRPDEDRATVDIDLPAGQVTGMVVNAEGKPAKATVHFRDDDRRAGSHLTEDGTFTFVGLDPDDDIQLFATARGASSPMVLHRVSKNESTVTLVLREKVKINGRVSSVRGQPVAGAIVRWVSAGMGVIERVTNSRGEFSLEADGNHDAVDLVILPPTPPVKTLSVPLSRADEPVEIVVGGPSGQLDFVYGGDSGDLDVRRWPLLRGGGGPIPLFTFRYPRTPGFPRRDSIPGGTRVEIEPGTYTLCPAATPSGDCITSVVVAGGHEVIDARTFAR